LDSGELERLMAKPDALQQVIKEKTLGKSNIQVQNTLRDIKEKYDEIIVLEGNVNHIMRLLGDMKDLIVDQGDDAEKLLGTIQDAKGLTQKGQDNLVKAKEYYKATKKRQWWMCGCCCVAVVVVVAPVILTTLVNKGSIRLII
jgi:t-SNARE complex subunit (syntaxin)